MTSDYYFKPFFNWYSRVMRCIPVIEEKFNRKAIRDSIDVLNAGNAIGVFPQGGLMPDNDFSDARSGVALLVMKSKAPLIPIKITGTAKAFPKGARFIRPRPIEVRIGAPVQIDMSDNNSAGSKHDRLEKITQALMKSISDL